MVITNAWKTAVATLISINFIPKTSHRFPKNIVYYVFQVGYWHGSFGSVFDLGSETFLFSEQKIDVPHPSPNFVRKFA